MMAKWRSDGNGGEWLLCDVCGAIMPVIYQLKDDVWRQAGFSRTDNACPRCLIERLGRRPTVDDFVFAPINQLVFMVTPGARIPEPAPMNLQREAEADEFKVDQPRRR